MMELDWANLNADALCLILDKLEERIHHIWFGAVCKNWLSAAKIHHQNRRNNDVVPMLMVKGNSYSILGAGMYSFQPLQFLNSAFCYGFSHGWFATMDSSRSGIITLRNPFKKKVSPIHLPPHPTKGDNDAGWLCSAKVILSCDPLTTKNDYVVATGLGDCIYFIRAGQKSWTLVRNFGLSDWCTDITFYKDVIYSVNRRCKIVYFDPCSSRGVTKQILLNGSNVGFEGLFNGSIVDIDGDVDGDFNRKCYFVKSLEGDLWLVLRFFNKELCKVYKVELGLQEPKFVHLESLGDNVLFLDDYNSFSVPLSNFSGCLQKDSIYYRPSTHYWKVAYHFKIYNLKDESSHCQFLNTSFFKEKPFHAYWIQPSFNWD